MQSASRLVNTPACWGVAHPTSTGTEAPMLRTFQVSCDVSLHLAVCLALYHILYYIIHWYVCCPEFCVLFYQVTGSKEGVMGTSDL